MQKPSLDDRIEQLSAIEAFPPPRSGKIMRRLLRDIAEGCDHRPHHLLDIIPDC
jgi:acyl-coenzyme A synthetase/AMP-(fatty) acid ligase